jgi:hypothetical protein
MRWVPRWSAGSCVVVGRKRKLRRRYTRIKKQQGVLRAPLTVEGVTTAEAAEVPAMGGSLR